MKFVSFVELKKFSVSLEHPLGCSMGRIKRKGRETVAHSFLNTRAFDDNTPNCTLYGREKSFAIP